MFKIALVVFLCAVYADTVYVIAALFASALVLESEATREPVFSIALQVVLSLLAASLVRRARYGDAKQFWTIAAPLSNKEIPHSFERLVLAGLLYLSCLTYNSRLDNGYPIGMYATTLVSALVLWIFDVVAHIQAGHRHHQRLHEDDSHRTEHAHTHTMEFKNFSSMMVIATVAVFIVWPDTIVAFPKLSTALGPPGLLLCISALTGMLGMLVNRY